MPPPSAFLPACRLGDVRQRLLRVADIGPAVEEEMFTTSLHSNISVGTITQAEATALCARAGQSYTDTVLVVM